MFDGKIGPSIIKAMSYILWNKKSNNNVLHVNKVIDDNIPPISSTSYVQMMNQLKSAPDVLSNEKEETIDKKIILMQLTKGEVNSLDKNRSDKEAKLCEAIKLYSIATMNFNYLIESPNYSFQDYSKCYQQRYLSLKRIDASCKDYFHNKVIIQIQQAVQHMLESLLDEAMALTKKQSADGNVVGIHSVILEPSYSR